MRKRRIQKEADMFSVSIVCIERKPTPQKRTPKRVNLMLIFVSSVREYSNWYSGAAPKA